MKVLKFIVLLLVIIGALNWGLWGFFQYDLVADIFGGRSTGWARFVYAIIGLAGLYGISFFWCRGVCSGGSCPKCGCSEKKNDQGNQGGQGQGQPH